MKSNITKSISETNGLNNIDESCINILSVGISTACEAEMKMIDKNNKCKVIATTIDNEGIVFSNNILKEKGYDKSITIKLEDVSKTMPYNDSYFDFIYARLVLHYLDKTNLKKALNELRRVLKVNKKLYIVVRSNKDIATTLSDSVYDEETNMTKHADYKTLYSNNFKYIYRSFHSKENITNYLEDAGFTIKYIKEYDEHLYSDFERKEKSLMTSSLLEILAINNVK